MTVRDAVNDRLAGVAPGQPTIEFDAVEGETPPAPEQGPEVAPGSVLGALRARAASLREHKTIDLPVPGYSDEGLVGRYRAVSLTKTLTRSNTMNPVLPEWHVAADALASALVELLIRNPETGELESFAPGVCIRFDDDLVGALALEPEERTARAVLKALVGGGELGESRISAMFFAYQGWLMGGVEGENPAQEVAEAAVGEFRGALIDVVAVGALCGLPVARIIEGDEIERELWARVVKRASELRVQLMRAEASHVGAAVARVFGGK